MKIQTKVLLVRWIFAVAFMFWDNRVFTGIDKLHELTKELAMAILKDE